MANVTFSKALMFNHARPQVVESSFRAYAAFSGIHDFNFDKLYELAEDDWSSDDITITFNEDTLELDASALSAEWHIALQDTDLPVEHLINYHKTAVRQAIVVGYQPNGNHWIAGTDGDGFPVILKFSNDTYTTVLSIPKETPEEADVMVAFREFKFGESVEEFWHTISIWMNDALIATYSEVSATGQITTDVQFGFAAYGGDDPVGYTEVEIPEITEFAEWSSLDPAEYPISGLQRAIEGRYLKFFIRFNGTLRAWKPKATDIVKEFDDDQVEGYRDSFDKRALKTHVRMVGAYTEAEYVRPDLWPKYGHTFTEVNNPYLMTEQDCFREARREIQRMEQQAFKEDFQTPVTPLIEIEDRVSTPRGERIVDSISLDFTPAEIEQTISARLYNF
jgi:hypothetical protein